ncbi:MAG: hypothetical protein AAF608_05180 [Pseudomonadota bacterium]
MSADQSAHGLLLEPQLKVDLLKVLTELWRKPCSCKGDYARSKAAIIAMAASEDLITTRLPDGYATEWRVTAKGLALLEEETP